jgi:hypothetical protein
MSDDTYKIFDFGNKSTFIASYNHKDIWNITITNKNKTTEFNLNHKEAEQLYFLLLDTIGTPSEREII